MVEYGQEHADAVVAHAESPEMSYFARGMMSSVEDDAADHPGHARPVQSSMFVGLQRERPGNLKAAPTRGG